jgi:hypothetical protein
MNLKNQIVSYFVDPDSPPKVYKSPVTMGESVAREILKKEHGFPLTGKPMLHICYDLDSELIYLPNGSNFTKEQLEPLVLAGKYHIQKTYKNFKNIPPIHGSPFSSLRIRKVSNFGYIKESLEEQFGEYKDLTVVEANLCRMPSTTKGLPKIYHNNKNFSGGLISKTTTFYDEIDIHGRRRKNPIELFTVSGPFILIDISPQVETSSTEKEWVVLSAYRDFVDKYSENKKGIDFAPFYAAKRYLHLGWPFEEVCAVFIDDCIQNFGSLMKASNELYSLYSELKEIGGSKHNYYYAFKIGDDFPFNFKTSKKDIPFFNVIKYDETSKNILIKSPVYFSPQICKSVLKCKSAPFIAKYNSAINKIDVKVSEKVFKERLNKSNITSVIKKYIEQEVGVSDLSYRSDKRSSSISLSSSEICHIRKISDYPYARQHIEEMCKERNMQFEDVDVVVGPIERIFGRGVQGGFMGKKQFEDSKMKTPYELEKGLFINYPVISVNSETMTSYAEQTETLIHEYSHKLYSVSNPYHEHLYNKDNKLRNKDPKKYWELYLGDKDEQLAHKQEIKFELISGKSVDEIVRDKVGGAITKEGYKQTYFTALTFKKLVDEVVIQMEK